MEEGGREEGVNEREHFTNLNGGVEEAVIFSSWIQKTLVGEGHGHLSAKGPGPIEGIQLRRDEQRHG